MESTSHKLIRLINSSFSLLTMESSIKSPQCTGKYSNKVFSIAIFLPRVLMYQKHQISLPVGYKTATPKTGDWERLWRQFRSPSLAKNRFLRRFLIFSLTKALFYHFLPNWLAHNKKMTEKSFNRLPCSSWVVQILPAFVRLTLKPSKAVFRDSLITILAIW